MSGSVSDDVELDLFGNAVKPAFDGVLGPGAAFAISKDVSCRILCRQPSEDLCSLGNEVNHAGFSLTLGLVGRKDDHVIENEACLDRAGLDRTTSGAVQEVEQIIEGSFSMFADLLPLLVRVKHIPPLLLRLPHPCDRIAEQIALFHCPVEISLDNADRVGAAR